MWGGACLVNLSGFICSPIKSIGITSKFRFCFDQYLILACQVIFQNRISSKLGRCMWQPKNVMLHKQLIFSFNSIIKTENKKFSLFHPNFFLTLFMIFWLLFDTQLNMRKFAWLLEKKNLDALMLPTRLQIFEYLHCENLINKATTAEYRRPLINYVLVKLPDYPIETVTNKISFLCYKISYRW